MNPRSVRLVVFSMVLSSILAAQDGRLEFAVQGGVTSGLTQVVGGQAAVRLVRGVHLGATGITAVGIQAGATSRLWEAAMRFTPSSSLVKPYLSLGFGWIREGVAPSLRNEEGISLGLGIEVGRTRFRGFAEGKVVR